MIVRIMTENQYRLTDEDAAALPFVGKAVVSGSGSIAGKLNWWQPAQYFGPPKSSREAILELFDKSFAQA